MTLTPRFPRRSVNARKARLTFRAKKAGLSPHLFLREIYMGSMCREKPSFLFFLPPPFFPFPRFSRLTRTWRGCWEVSPRVLWCVLSAWVSLGDPTFSASGHPTHSLGLPIESQTLTLTLWATQWVSRGSLGSPQWAFNPNPNPRKPSETLGTSRTHTASFHPWETSPLISPHVQGYLTLVRKIPRILELPALPPGWKRLEVIHSSIQVLIESFWSPWKLSIEWLLTSYHAPLNQHFFIGFGFRSSKKDPLVSWMANFASLPFPFLHSTSPIYYWTASHPNLHGFQFNSLDYQINPFYYLSGFFI